MGKSGEDKDSDKATAAVAPSVQAFAGSEPALMLCSTAKSYKRPTKKEKLGLSQVSTSRSHMKPVAKQAPISAQFSTADPALTNNTRVLEDNSAISQAAQKLLLEAEKRAVTNGNAQIDEEEEEEDVEMGEERVDPGKPKKKAGASGMKAKTQKPRPQRLGEEKAQRDYVDLL
ncbi:MAG: hypothetical protein CYPHOPRED_006009 [Cyphobasidiales sp. Tagirdzhanova-0007]|nr:MAG: hypothetical protein CYPHOPRED_006009 [Cyphobasidiales sp. Tagirdzhanova-0007]